MTTYPDDLVSPLTSKTLGEWLDTHEDDADASADDVRMMALFRAECENSVGSEWWYARTWSEWVEECADLAEEKYGSVVLSRAWDDVVWAEECATDAAIVDVGPVRYVVTEQ